MQPDHIYIYIYIPPSQTVPILFRVAANNWQGFLAARRNVTFLCPTEMSHNLILSYPVAQTDAFFLQLRILSFLCSPQVQKEAGGLGLGPTEG